MNEIICQLPAYIKPIIDRLSAKNWLTHSFPLGEVNQTYDITSYIFNHEIEKITYTIVLDVNIYQFIINISKKEKCNETQRDAAALLVFCQAASIELNPKWAVYEKLNYDNTKNIQEVIEDLEIFNSLNNSDPEELAKFSCGIINEVNLCEQYPINKDALKKELLTNESLIEWESIYLIALAIVDINNNPEIKDNKLSTFINWMLKYFRKSFMTVLYAAFLFSKSPLRKMMKYKACDNKIKRNQQLYNMTWDLYLMRQYFKLWVAGIKDKESIFASDDKTFNKMLRKGINIQKSQDFSFFINVLGKIDYDNLVSLLRKEHSDIERKYKSPEWSQEYIINSIKKYQEKLCLCE